MLETRRHLLHGMLQKNEILVLQHCTTGVDTQCNLTIARNIAPCIRALSCATTKWRSFSHSKLSNAFTAKKAAPLSNKEKFCRRRCSDNMCSICFITQLGVLAGSQGYSEGIKQGALVKRKWPVIF